MKVNNKALVLRTVYLNPEQDEELRKISSHLKIGKNELIRQLIDLGLAHKEEIKGLL